MRGTEKGLGLKSLYMKRELNFLYVLEIIHYYQCKETLLFHNEHVFSQFCEWVRCLRHSELTYMSPTSVSEELVCEIEHCKVIMLAIVIQSLSMKQILTCCLLTACWRAFLCVKSTVRWANGVVLLLARQRELFILGEC